MAEGAGLVLGGDHAVYEGLLHAGDAAVEHRQVQVGFLAELEHRQLRAFGAHRGAYEVQPAVERPRRLPEREHQVQRAPEVDGADADDPLPRLPARAIAGAHRATMAEIRRQVVAGGDPEDIRRSVVAAAERAFGMLASGLGGEGDRPTR
ncbi:hypothetical protein ACIRP0_14075 [Streptomyces sp. NPDC101733]|uniref:hypothetical protein n=1 Tax=unclassified Streptomyces TaxID=2593676 RepID=UPI0037F1AF30